MSMFIRRSLSRALFGASLLFSCSTASLARNGFIPHYVGLEGIISGAGTALPLDATSTIANPAGLPRIQSHFLATLGISGQRQTVNSTNAPIGNPIGKQANRFMVLPIGSLGFNYNINPCWSVGFALTGGGGFVKFKYPVKNPMVLTPTPGHYDKYTVNQVMLSATSLSYQPTSDQSYGISLLVASSNFKSDLALPLPGGFPFAEVKGHKRGNLVFGVGTRIGGIWDFGKYFTLGASAATPVFFPRHNKYKQLFKHRFQIPGTARLGLAWHVSPCTDICVDYKELFYGEAKWVNEGQKWHNQVIFLTGIIHRITKDFMVGLGYNYAKVPIKKSAVYLNTLSIPLDEHHISGGFNYKFDKATKELFLVTFYVPQKSITDNGKALPGGPTKGIRMKSYAYGFEIGARMNF